MRSAAIIVGVLLVVGGVAWLTLRAPDRPADLGYDRAVAVIIAPGQQTNPASAIGARLAQRGVEVIELLRGDAELSVLRGVMMSLRAAPGDRTLLVIYYDGRAEPAEGDDRLLLSDGARGLHPTLLRPTEERPAALRSLGEVPDLALSTLAEWAGETGFTHQLLILDATLTGPLPEPLDEPPLAARRHALGQPGATDAAIVEGWSRPARLIIAAGGGAPTHPAASPTGGAFAATVLGALDGVEPRDAVSADRDGDGCVSGPELRARVEHLGAEPGRTPRIGALPGHDGGVLTVCAGRISRPAPGPSPSLGWVRVEAGLFRMGPGSGEGDSTSLEIPARWVRLTSPLWAQAHEVTRGEWRALMGNDPSDAPPCDECPVDRVNWFEALAYANALSESQSLTPCYTLAECTDDVIGEGCPPGWRICPGWSCQVAERAADSPSACTGYRLPTEAEWEYLARASAATRYAVGDGIFDLSTAGWHRGNSGRQVRAVGQLIPNRWGLHDMHGGVAEWCEDPFTLPELSMRYVPDDPLVDPRPAAPEPPWHDHPLTDWDRVIRGGHALSPAPAVRSASRDFLGAATRLPYVGFRLVRAAPAP